MHPPATGSPCWTSQYEPAGSEVWKVRAIAPLSRLIATKPLPPRPKAIALLPSDHQSVSPAPATALRKPTMLATCRQAWVQFQPSW